MAQGRQAIILCKAPTKRIQRHSTLLDGVGLRGQTNATCCAVETRIVVIRDLE